jgi:hypothetical protein
MYDGSASIGSSSFAGFSATFSAACSLVHGRSVWPYWRLIFSA